MKFTTAVLISALAVAACTLTPVQARRHGGHHANVAVTEAAAAQNKIAAYHAEQFEDFKKQYGRNYSGVEHDAKFAVFRDNMNAYAAHNAHPDSTWVKGIDQFADMTHKEFVNWLRSQPMPASPAAVSAEEFQTPADWSVDIPNFVDLRQNNRVSSVKNQGSGGYCWAFAAAAGIESAHAASKGQLLDLSPQQLVDCCGSMGGSNEGAFNCVKAHNGITTFNNYPYTAQQGACQGGRPSAAWVGSTVVIPQDAGKIANAIAALHVVSIGINADSMQGYKSGFLSDNSKCSGGRDHAVAIVGYGWDQGTNTNFWIVKNQWGTGWGVNGYMYIKRGVNMCNCESDASYPVSP